MDNQKSSKAKIQRMTGMSILSAMVLVLTIFCTFIKFGPFSITLALAPIIIGAALYDAKAGTFLGALFGVVVLITGLLGWDGGTVLFLFTQKAVATVLTCIIKGAAAGFAAGIVYKYVSKKNELLAVILASIVCPLVNTGIFIVSMLVFFYGILVTWASGTQLVYYLIFSLTGVNFVIELVTNLVLSSGISRIIKIGKQK